MGDRTDFGTEIVPGTEPEFIGPTRPLEGQARRNNSKGNNQVREELRRLRTWWIWFNIRVQPQVNSLAGRGNRTDDHAAQGRRTPPRPTPQAGTLAQLQPTGAGRSRTPVVSGPWRASPRTVCHRAGSLWLVQAGKQRLSPTYVKGPLLRRTRLGPRVWSTRESSSAWRSATASATRRRTRHGPTGRTSSGSPCALRRSGPMVPASRCTSLQRSATMCCASSRPRTGVRDRCTHIRMPLFTRA